MPSLCLCLLIWDNYTKTHTGTEYEPSIYPEFRFPLNTFLYFMNFKAQF